METITLYLLSLPFIIGVSLLALIAIIVGVLIEKEKTGWVGTITTALIIFTIYSFKTEVVYFLTTNPIKIIGYTLGYIALGITWSIIKWRTYVVEKMDIFKRVKNEFIRDYGTITTTNWSIYIDHLNYNRNILQFNHDESYSLELKTSDTNADVVGKILPQASTHKALITTWISHWLISFVATFLNNPFRKAFEFLYDRLAGVFHNISVGVGKNYLD
jgi:hypothetical protein